MFSSIGN